MKQYSLSRRKKYKEKQRIKAIAKEWMENDPFYQYGYTRLILPFIALLVSLLTILCKILI